MEGNSADCGAALQIRSGNPSTPMDVRMTGGGVRGHRGVPAISLINAATLEVVETDMGASKDDNTEDVRGCPNFDGIVSFRADENGCYLP